MYDPLEHLDEAERNDFEVRQHLYAQRQLRDLDRIDTRAKVAKMLAEVVPKAKVCSMLRAPGVDDLGEGSKQRAVCGRAGVRMIASTGDWTCAECDPLRHPAPPVTGCCGKEITTCDERAGAWGCTAGITGHGWPHRFMRLEAD